MKYAFFLILFSGFGTFCLGQTAASSYILTINYTPSFTSASKLIIHSGQDSCYAQMGICKNYRKNIYDYSDKHLITPVDMQSLTSFLKSYRFRITGSVDSVISYEKGTSGDSVRVVHVTMGMDGITVHGVLDQNNTTRNFEFWSPKKGTENSLFAKMLFSIMDKSFTNETFATYIKALKEYFDR